MNATKSIKEGLSSWLGTIGPLADLVADRIHFGERPEGGDLPAVAFFRESGEQFHVSAGRAGLEIGRFAFECWSDTGQIAEAVAQALTGTSSQPALDDFVAGWMGDIWVGAVRIDDVGDSKVPPAHAEGTSLHRVTIRASIWFDEDAVKPGS